MSNVYKDDKTMIVLFVNKIDEIDKKFKLDLKKFIQFIV